MSRRNDEILKKIHSKGSQIIKRDDDERESPVGCSTGKNKIILLMTDHLFIVGGAETRIVRTAELLEDLKFIPVILSQHNNHPPSQKFFNLTLDYRDPNLSSIISSWIERGLIHGIEFHIKNPRVLYRSSVVRLEKQNSSWSSDSQCFLSNRQASANNSIIAAT